MQEPMTDVSTEELEAHLLQAHKQNPSDLYVLNELVFFYASNKPDKEKEDYYERLFRKICEKRFGG